MWRKALGFVGIVVVVALVATLVAIWVVPGQAEAAYGGHQGSGRRGAGGTGTASRPAAPIAATPGDLSASEEEALMMALNDEYKSWALYDQVIADFGSVQPFTSIQRSETSHISALVTLFERYDLEAPENAWVGNVPSFDTLSDACAAGVQAEIDNEALYDELFGMVDNADIVRVFTSLQRASETRHLPAFERCAY